MTWKLWWRKRAQGSGQESSHLSGQGEGKREQDGGGVRKYRCRKTQLETWGYLPSQHSVLFYCWLFNACCMSILKSEVRLQALPSAGSCPCPWAAPPRCSLCSLSPVPPDSLSFLGGNTALTAANSFVLPYSLVTLLRDINSS